MTDPKRLLLGDGDEQERRLLAAAAAEEPPADGARRLALALGVGAAGLSGAASAKASSGALGKITGSKLAANIALALLLGGGATLAISWRGQAPAAPSPPSPSRPETTLPAAQAPEPAEARASDPPQDAPSVQPAARSIADEVLRLDAARRALSARDPEAALLALDAYARSYTRGTLRPEAQRLCVEAWLAKGDAARARSLARDFLRAYPQSPYAANMRRIAESLVE